MDPAQLKLILEAALFAANQPLSIDRMLTLFIDGGQPAREEIRSALDQLKTDYQQRGVELHEVSSGFRFQTRQQFAPWIARLWEERPQRYSRALLETLSLIAYRQPITRAEIEDVRGVGVSSQIVKTLEERGWVRVVGHKDLPGRPALLATTREFLDYFNLKSLDQLPPLAEIRSLDDVLQVRGSAAEGGSDEQEIVELAAPVVAAVHDITDAPANDAAVPAAEIERSADTPLH
ncbi:MAG: SMC-Scp complex subunit ScpB [Gammaproteobacteria bacterium]|nr:SMC-Scp complex subunit ScpB [Gammaproteobacteria bacterium]